MTKTTNLHIQIDPEIKSNAEQLFSSFGITISDAVIMFLRQSILVGGLRQVCQEELFGSTVYVKI